SARGARGRRAGRARTLPVRGCLKIRGCGRLLTRRELSMALEVQTLVDPNRTQHQETVVPIKPGVRATRAQRAAPARATPEGRPSRSPFWQYLAGGFLIAAAVFAFALFPRLVERSQSKPASTAAAPAASAPAEAPLSPEEAAAFKSKAEALLSQLLAQQ